MNGIESLQAALLRPREIVYTQDRKSGVWNAGEVCVGVRSYGNLGLLAS